MNFDVITSKIDCLLWFLLNRHLFPLDLAFFPFLNRMCWSWSSIASLDKSRAEVTKCAAFSLSVGGGVSLTRRFQRAHEWLNTQARRAPDTLAKGRSPPRPPCSSERDCDSRSVPLLKSFSVKSFTDVTYRWGGEDSGVLRGVWHPRQGVLGCNPDPFLVPNDMWLQLQLFIFFYRSNLFLWYVCVAIFPNQSTALYITKTSYYEHATCIQVFQW